MVGGFRIMLRREAVDRRGVLAPEFRVMRSDFAGSLPRAFRRRFHLVFAVVGIGNQVSDVRNVNDVRDVEAFRNKKALQQVREKTRANISDMLFGVDRRTTAVDPDLARCQRFERPLLATPRVIKLDLAQSPLHSVLCPISFGSEQQSPLKSAESDSAIFQQDDGHSGDSFTSAQRAQMIRTRHLNIHPPGLCTEN